jgi:preprotein translocase subunit SecY
MIRPVLPPHELTKLILNMYQEHPGLLISIGVVFGLAIAGLVVFLIKEARKVPIEQKEGGKE